MKAEQRQCRQKMLRIDGPKLRGGAEKRHESESMENQVRNMHLGILQV